MQSIATQKHKTLRNKCFVFLFVLVSSFSFTSLVSAFTTLSGTQTTDLYLTVENSPYVVQGILEMNPGRTLHMDPGVIVKFQDETSGVILNNAILDANGTETEKIYFTSIKDDTVGGDTNGDGNTTTPAQGDWKYIYFAGTSFPNNLSHIVVRYAGATNVPAIWHYFSAGLLTITDSSITDNLYTGITSRNSTVIITNSQISNNTNYGVSTNGSLTATNNYWGDPTGPTHTSNPTGLGDSVSDGVTFEPWLGVWPPVPPETDCTVDCFSNVLFLPGIQGSRLYDLRENGTEDQLWEPNGNSDVEDLYLNPDGTSRNQNIYTRDVIKRTNIGILDRDIYKSFSERMDQLVIQEKIIKWQSFAYDWRQDVVDIVENGTQYSEGIRKLEDTVLELSSNSKNSGKVIIVAHSTGGLVAKAFLKYLQDEKNAGRSNLIDKVDVLVLVAVPQIGTPDAVNVLLHGMSLGEGLIMDKTRSRLFARNMLGVYGLLPSREYLNRVSASPVVFEDNVIPSSILSQYLSHYGNVIDSYNEYKNFLFGGEGRVEPSPSDVYSPIKLLPSLFAKSEALHDSIDNWTPPSSMRVIQIAGWGIDTLATIKYFPRRTCVSIINCEDVLDQSPVFTSNGDKTVVGPSAHYMGTGSQVYKYWVNLPFYNSSSGGNIEHADIFEASNLLTFLENLIQDNTITDSIITTTEPIDISNRLRISLLSPVSVDAYDSFGNHTGKVCPQSSDFCFAEEKIPNSSYWEIGEGKYLNIPEANMDKIKLQGTGIGTFTYKSEKVLPSGISIVSSFVDIPVTTQTQAEVTLNQSQIPELKLDVEGDGVNDFTITPNDIFNPITYLQIMKATVNSLDITQAKKNAFGKRVDSIIKSIQKGKIDKAKLKADKFKDAFEKKIAKPDPIYPKPKKLSKTDAQILLDMLNKLLDNLE